MTARREAILAAAQQELRRSHRRRIVRRRLVSSGAALLVLTALTLTALTRPRPERAFRPEAAVVHGENAAPAAPGDRGRPSGGAESSALAAEAPRPPTNEPAAGTPASERRLRIEVVTSVAPEAGFVEWLDDRELEIALRQLPTPTGVAVIAGRTHLVANPALRHSEPLR